MNYYRRYIGDYQRDTMHLSLMEHGAYAMLLDSFYAQDGNLPETQSVLFRLCRATTDEEKAAVALVAQEFFPVVNGKRVNKRGTEELEAAIPRIQSAKENGAKGGRPSKKNPQETGLKTQWVSGTETHTEPDSKAIQPPTTNHQPPATIPQPPTASLQPKTRKSKPCAGDESPTPEGKSVAVTSEVWRAYANAYALRYGTAPLRNARVNGQLKLFLSRVPKESAPAVAAFYVTSNRSVYAGAKHCTDLLLRDAEAHHTAWVTGHAATDTEARMADRTAANGNVFRELIAEAEERELANGSL